jgi:hypothetical protein
MAQGRRVFDFGRCSPGSGTHRFKRQWGGADVPLPWLQWRPQLRGAAGAMPSSDGRLFKLAARVWRLLPRRVATSWGPTFARWLP